VVEDCVEQIDAENKALETTWSWRRSRPGRTKPASIHRDRSGGGLKTIAS